MNEELKRLKEALQKAEAIRLSGQPGFSLSESRERLERLYQKVNNYGK